MANTDQIVSRIKRRLSRTSVASLDATIIDELNATQEEFEGRGQLPSFIQTFDDITLLADDDLVDVAAELSPGFIRFVDDSPVQIRLVGATETWQPIEKFITTEELRDRHTGRGSTPKGWAFNFPLVMIRPIPDTTIELRFSYYYRAPAMTAGNSTVWTVNAADLLTSYTGMEVAQQLRDANAQKYFADKYRLANMNYLKRLAAEEMAGLSTSRGED